VNNHNGERKSYFPQVAINDIGNSLICWTELNDEEGSGDVYASVFDIDNNTLADNIRLNDQKILHSYTLTSVTQIENNDFLVCWEDNVDESRGITVQRVSFDGMKLGGNNIIEKRDNRYKSSPYVASNNVTNIITWEYNDNIYFSFISSDGYADGEKIEITQDSTRLFDDRNPVCSIDEYGNFLICWQRYDEGWNIYAQLFSNNGNPIGNRFQVNDVLGSADNNMGIFSIDCDAIGNYLIVWTDIKNGNEDIYAQKIDGQGSKIGNNFIIHDQNINNQFVPNVKLHDGKIYTTWTDTRGENTGYDIWANVLDWENPTAIENEEQHGLAEIYSLSQNYPNPFNPSTMINYQLPMASEVSLNVYDILGKKVVTLVNQKQQAGHYEVDFDAIGFSSGIYFYTLEINNRIYETKKMVLMK